MENITKFDLTLTLEEKKKTECEYLLDTILSATRRYNSLSLSPLSIISLTAGRVESLHAIRQCIEVEELVTDTGVSGQVCKERAFLDRLAHHDGALQKSMIRERFQMLSRIGFRGSLAVLDYKRAEAVMSNTVLFRELSFLVVEYIDNVGVFCFCFLARTHRVSL